MRIVSGAATTNWALIGFASDAELTAAPVRIRKIKAPLPPPRAWTLEELSRLLEVAAALRGVLRGKSVSRAAFWRCFVLVGYETGLRLGDLLALRIDQIADGGKMVLAQSKTGGQVCCQLGPEAADLVRQIAVGPKVFALSRHRS